MAKNNERYSKSAQVVARELAVNEQNARTSAARLAQEQEILRQQREFVQPGENVELASATQGFDANQGTSAGGLAYRQGVDFGSQIQIPNQGDGLSQAPNQVSYTDAERPEDLQQIDLEGFYNGYSELDEIGRTAARLGVDVRNINPLDPDEKEIGQQYWSKYNQLQARAEELQQGYLAEQKRQEKNQIMEDREPGRGSQFGDAFDAKKYDFDVTALGDFAKDVYTRESLGAANLQLFGSKDGDMYSAFRTGGGRVGQYFMMAQELEDNGQPKEANLVRQKMFDVLGPIYDSTKQQGLALEKEKLDNDKDKFAYAKQKDYKGTKETFDQVANIEERIYKLQNHGELSFIRQSYPDARFEETAGGKFLVYSKKNALGFQMEKARINVKDHTALASVFIGSSKFGDIKLSDYQEVGNTYGDYLPDPDDNWQVAINTKSLWNVAEEAMKDGSVENVTAVKEWIKPYMSMLEVGGKRVTHLTLDDAGIWGSGDTGLVFNFDTGDPIRLDFDNKDDMVLLDNMVKSINHEDAVSYMNDKGWAVFEEGKRAEEPKEGELQTWYKTDEEGNTYREGAPFYKRKRDGDSEEGNRERRAERVKSRTEFESSSSSAPVSTPVKNKSGFDINKRL